MCGVFGYIGSIDASLLQCCTNILTHRGPDGYGEWCSSEASFGHRRLAILDLSDHGKQPMASPDGRFILTFNGEVYNYIEIRSELKKKGYVFHSDCDSEVVLAAFIEWREKCLDKFNGMWAFAIWDTKEKRLFLARDRFGIKPLFYTQLPGGRFAFASEMKAIFPLLDQVRANEELVRDHSLIFTYETTDECVIEGIKRFPIGHYGYYKDGKLITKRWWCTLDHLPQVPSSYDEQVEQFRELFIDSCRLRMRSDVPIGTALSGGLDSSATISTMAHIAKAGDASRVGNEWQHAFIASFPGTPLDETDYALKVTEHIGIDATIIDIDPTQAVDKLESYFYLFEDLYITSPIPFMLTYEEVKSHGISVTLDGHGADELFAGYNFDYLSALKDAGLNLRDIRSVLDTYYSSEPFGVQSNGLPPKAIFWLEYYARNVARQVLRRSSMNTYKFDVDSPRWKKLDHLGRQLYASTHETVLPTLLRNYDRYSMANGVEIRMPFMDYRIATFAFALPWDSKIRDGFSKSVVRDAVSSFMPKEIAYRKTKIGFNSPVVDWMKGPLREYLLDMILSKEFEYCGLVDVEEAKKSVEYVINSPDAQFVDGERAWMKISPFLWQRSVIRN